MRAPVSPFQNSDMVATGLPSPEELKLLEPFRGQVPDEVFGEPFVPPVSDGSGQDRTLLRKAQQLLKDAGYVVKDGKRLLPNGEVFTIEFLLDEPSFQPHHATFIKNLGQLGIEAGIRLIDAVQYRARVESFDFDVTIQRMSMSATPGDSLRPYFSSQAAATKGSYNLAGVANPGDRRAGREGDRRRNPRRSDLCVPGARPGVPRRPLLGAAMVPLDPPDRLLGYVRSSGKAGRNTRRAPARRKTGGTTPPRPRPTPSRRSNS